MSEVRLAAIEHRGAFLDIEYQWVGAADWRAPVLVFLHEGLGSRAMWRDFPDRLARQLGMRGLVYSRPGYGRSSPRPTDEKWPVDFMSVQAREVLPALLDTLDLKEPVTLIGHSDGGSIALLFASYLPQRVRAVIALAPHLFVEDISVDSIAAARDAYRTTDLRARLARYHDDVDSAFWGWNDIWLNPDFRHWAIEREMASITAPVLAVQGDGDQYGTFAQVEALQRAAPRTKLLKLENCGHSVHRDQPEAVIAAAVAFVRQTG